MTKTQSFRSALVTRFSWNLGTPEGYHLKILSYLRQQKRGHGTAHDQLFS